MKNPITLFIIAFSAASLLAEPAAQPAAKKATITYKSEAPLPKGWPTPGPYNQVSEKGYPAYRAAITKNSGSLAFFTLFGHIKRQDIPMTAPVEMEMAQNGNKFEKVSMAFLYQNTEVGTTGTDGKKIQIQDLPKTKALSYTWMGDDSKANIKLAKTALDAQLKAKNLTATSFRMLGYNGPSTPKKNRTYELQAILTKE